MPKEPTIKMHIDLDSFEFESACAMLEGLKKTALECALAVKAANLEIEHNAELHRKLVRHGK